MVTMVLQEAMETTELMLKPELNQLPPISASIAHQDQ